MSDTRLDTLKINVLSQSQYDSATKDENQLYLITDQISDVDSRYGLCSTSSSTANKEVTIADKDFSLITGARVTVNFQNNNSATNPTLNVNQSGAKPIYYTKKVLPSNAYWMAGDIIDFIYDGTNWNIITETSPRADKLTTARYIDGITFNGASNIHHYGTCSTAAGTAAKTASVNGGSNFSLVTGAKIYIKFSAANTVANPTLNINSTGAKNIYYQGAALTVAQSWEAGETVPFIYDGTNWNIISAPSTKTKKLSTIRYIDGAKFDGTANSHHYGSCSTAAATATKTASVNSSNGFSLVTGAKVTIKFSAANTVANPTLNISSTGAKAIYYQGAAITSEQYWEVGDVIDFIYDGTNWNMITAPAPKAEKLSTTRYIDGVAFNGTANIEHHGVCITAADEAEKTVSIAGTNNFLLTTGAKIVVRFTKENTTANPTLNVDSTGAKPIYYQGKPLDAEYFWGAEDIITFIYDNNYWHIIAGVEITINEIPNLYIWKVYDGNPNADYSTQEKTQIQETIYSEGFSWGGGYSYSVYYASNFTFNTTNKSFSLTNSKSTQDPNVLNTALQSGPIYVMIGYKTGSTMHKIPSDATVSKYSGTHPLFDYDITTMKFSKGTKYYFASFKNYIASKKNNTYPNDGTLNDNYYIYHKQLGE